MFKNVLMAAFFSQFVFAQTPVSWKDLQANVDSWIQGPVKLLLTEEERDVYKKLKTPEEKMRYIKIFWARRDPILRTRENEFKEEFYRRIDYANEKFGEGHTPGWMTARGRVYVLFGPPQREEKRILPDSNKPALLWVYNKIPSDKIPTNEALLFVYHDFKYVLAPPNPDPGDFIAAEQRELDRSFRYQDIPSAVQQAFVDVAEVNVIDEKKDYRDLLSSVESTVKFGVAGIDFDIKVMPSRPSKAEVVLKVENAPVYDDGAKVFAEFRVTQQLKKGESVVTGNEHLASFSWDQKTFSELTEIPISLPTLQAPPGDYALFVTVQDRISQVSETKKIEVRY
jgi:GWxTD domain-containing protein